MSLSKKQSGASTSGGWSPYQRPQLPNAALHSPDFQDWIKAWQQATPKRFWQADLLDWAASQSVDDMPKHNGSRLMSADKVKLALCVFASFADQKGETNAGKVLVGSRLSPKASQRTQENNYRIAAAELVRQGFLEYRSGGGNQATTYRVLWDNRWRNPLDDDHKEAPAQFQRKSPSNPTYQATDKVTKTASSNPTYQATDESPSYPTSYPTSYLSEMPVTQGKDHRRSKELKIDENGLETQVIDDPDFNNNFFVFDEHYLSPDQRLELRKVKAKQQADQPKLLAELAATNRQELRAKQEAANERLALEQRQLDDQAATDAGTKQQEADTKTNKVFLAIMATKTSDAGIVNYETANAYWQAASQSINDWLTVGRQAVAQNPKATQTINAWLQLHKKRIMQYGQQAVAS